MGPFVRGKYEWATPVYTKNESLISMIRFAQTFKVFSEL